MSYFITVGLILPDFVSEESKRQCFECVRNTILAVFTSKTTTGLLKFPVHTCALRLDHVKCWAPRNPPLHWSLKF